MNRFENVYLNEQVPDYQYWSGNRSTDKMSYFDPDASPLAFNYYNQRYTTENWILDKEKINLRELFPAITSRRGGDEDKNEDGNKVVFKRLGNNITLDKFGDTDACKKIGKCKNIDHKNESLYERLGERFYVSGETLFNFKVDKEEGKDPFADLDDSAQNSETSRRLRVAKAKVHTLQNMCLIPGTGGLQLVKSRDLYDRPDVLLVKLGAYYKKNVGSEVDDDILKLANEILSLATKCNRDPLDVFLKMFTDEKEFAQKMFLITDTSLLEDMLISGTKDLVAQYDEKNTPDNSLSLDDYITLAERYWEQRRNSDDEPYNKA